MRQRLFLAVLCLLFVPLTAFAQEDLNTVTCTFDDGKSVSLSFKSPAKNEKMPNNSVYTPGGVPMALLTETPLRFGNAQLPTGGYNVYVIPSKAKWTLVVNKGVKDTAYDATKDVARVQMDSGTIPGAATPFTVYLDHSGPKQCAVRIYNDKTGYFADFAEE